MTTNFSSYQGKKKAGTKPHHRHQWEKKIKERQKKRRKNAHLHGFSEEAESQSANGPIAHAKKKNATKARQGKRKKKRKNAHLRGVGEEAESQSANRPIAPSAKCVMNNAQNNNSSRFCTYV